MKIEEEASMEESSSNGLIRMLWGGKGKSRRSWRSQVQMVIVFTFIGCNESSWIITRSLNMFPSSAVCTRASVITSWMRIASNDLLTVLPPPESIFKTVWFHWALWYSCLTCLLLVLPAIINKLSVSLYAESGVWNNIILPSLASARIIKLSFITLATTSTTRIWSPTSRVCRFWNSKLERCYYTTLIHLLCYAFRWVIALVAPKRMEINITRVLSYWSFRS